MITCCLLVNKTELHNSSKQYQDNNVYVNCLWSKIEIYDNEEQQLCLVSAILSVLSLILKTDIFAKLMFE
jgi:hypothetical protein